MKKKYFVNNNPQMNGDYEVHASTCIYFPLIYNATYLGEFLTCAEAIREAKRRYPQANGCFHCSYLCHTT